MKRILPSLALAILFLPACAIKVYLVDRQTVLEDEAAGEWPEFEKQIMSRSLACAPEPFPVVAQSPNKARLFNVLNGELTGEGHKK